MTQAPNPLVFATLRSIAHRVVNSGDVLEVIRDDYGQRFYRVECLLDARTLRALELFDFDGCPDLETACDEDEAVDDGRCDDDERDDDRDNDGPADEDGLAEAIVDPFAVCAV